jgi:hypothetical protein
MFIQENSKVYLVVNLTTNVLIGTVFLLPEDLQEMQQKFISVNFAIIEVSGETFTSKQGLLRFYDEKLMGVSKTNDSLNEQESERKEEEIVNDKNDNDEFIQLI